MKLKDKLNLRSLIILTLFFAISVCGFSQTQNVRERVFIDVNSQDLLVGETLQYSAICLSHTTNKVSPLSKYLYVELVGESGVIFQRKHKLEEGKASGEFFLPSAIETGQYYLVAYTRWMRNFGDTEKTPLVFINPYKGHINPANENPELNVEFNTLSGDLVAGASNAVAFKVQFGNTPAIRSGRVIGEDGKIADVVSNEYGIGHFEITPEAGKQYQLLIEKPEGGIEFFDLPMATENGVGLNVAHSTDFINLTPLGDVQFSQLTINHQGKVVYEKRIESKSAIRIARKDLPKDILEVSLTDAGGARKFGAALFNTTIETSNLQESFATRTEASLDQNLPIGNYSVSIRKVSENQPQQNHSLYSKTGLQLPEHLSHSDLQYASFFQHVEQKDIPEYVSFIPEYRYELLEGSLKANSDTTSIDDKNVVLSLTGEDKLNMSVARTDKDGKFILEYQTVHRGQVTPAHLTAPDFENSYSLEITSNFIEEHDLNFSPIHIDSAQLEDIRQRSIISQIENVYFTPVIDSVEIENNVPSTIPVFNAHYEFDDYTRFRTLKEHFVEYIQVAGVRERRGKKRFILYSYDAGFSFETEPIVMLDGVPVPGNEILEFSPYRIKSLDAFNRRYFLGSFVADGILSFTTIEGNLGGFTFDSNHLAFELLTPQSENTASRVSLQEDERIPDSRIQLLWLPNLKIEQDGLQQIRFNTSDIEGDFEMVIEGFTESGLPISMVKQFEVKQLNNE